MMKRVLLRCIAILVCQQLWSATGFVAVTSKSGAIILEHTRAVGPLFAKKKKSAGKKKGSNAKQSGFAWAASFSVKPSESASLRELASTACASFEGRTGKPLSEVLKGASDIPKALWTAPIACMIIDAMPGTEDLDDSEEEGDADDDSDAESSGKLIVRYANVAALETVGLKGDQYDRLICTPDKDGVLRVPPLNDEINLPVGMKGDSKYEGGYKKKIFRDQNSDSSAKDITIEDAKRWTIEKSSLVGGKFVTTTLGVAYAWNTWLEGEDVLCRPGGMREQNVNTDDIEAQIQAQAAAIRELKEVQGFGNKDPEVLQAVEKLIGLKGVLAKAQEAASS